MMSLFSKSFKALRLVAATALLPLLASCQWMTEDYDVETDVSDALQYINVTISVSAGNDPVTRAYPAGGEYGDGSEKGIDERENKVNNITLIFYEDNAADLGINTTSDDVTVACVKRYAVRPFDAATDKPNSHTHKTGEDTDFQGREVLYTTGNQKLKETSLTIGKTYKVLVVANVDAIDVKVGDKIKDVREKVTSSVYTGSGVGIDASNFVMTSESEASVTLNNPTVETEGSENRFIYYFNCIHMERLAARIDYCTKGATYDATYGGYKYAGTGGAFFVVTKVTPFNLYNEQEFLFKRVQDGWTSPITTTWLGDESTTNYVVDPNTANKDNTNAFSYLSPIAENMTSLSDYAQFTRVMSAVQSIEGALITDGNSEKNVIIGYPRENTLMPTSYLQQYATGIAFEVTYYASASATPVTNVYYHYLRHQGELSSSDDTYTAERWGDLDANADGDDNPMKCGIVRNNIYRVSIEGINPTEGTIKITIEEKHWRHVDNPVIYI